MPFVTGGDYNSLPSSSVLAAYYNEDIFSEQGSGWQPEAEIGEKWLQKYRQVNEILQNKKQSGELAPIVGQLRSAYDLYNFDAGKAARQEVQKRVDLMPVLTHYVAAFYGTLDHLFYNTDHFEVLQLLETPQLSEC